MLTLKLNRNDFAQLFGEGARSKDMRNAARSGPPEYSPEPRTLWVTWSDEPGQLDALPQLIVVADEDINDFLAWAVTFLPPIKPLTAFIRTIPWSVYEMMRDIHPKPTDGLARVLVGAILGEAMIHSVGRSYFETLPLTAFDSTFSATLGRALMRGFSPELLKHTSRNWRFVRQITEQPKRREIPESFEDVWSVILLLAGHQIPNELISPQLEAIYKACSEIRETGGMSSFTWSRITQGRLTNSVYADVMLASKERRVEVFEEVVRALMQNSPDELSSSFLAGYFASLVSGGSLEHAHLVFPLQERLPMVMPWYGVCSALIPGSRVLTDYSYLGLRLVRAMSYREGLLSPPSCDIAVSEFEVLLRGDQRAQAFRQTNSSFLRVEVAPTVTTVVKWPIKAISGGQLSLFGGEGSPSMPEADRLRDLLKAVRKSLSLAEGLLAVETEHPNPKPSQKRGGKVSVRRRQ
jgi:hypothetical protein